MGATDLKTLERALAPRAFGDARALTGWSSARIEKQVTLDGEGRPHREQWTAIVSGKHGDAVVPLHEIHYLRRDETIPVRPIDKE